MHEKLLGMYIMMQMKMAGLIEDFRNYERGASDIVSIIMVIIVVIAVAAIFRQQLQRVITDAFGKVSEFIGGAETGL